MDDMINRHDKVNSRREITIFFISVPRFSVHSATKIQIISMVRDKIISLHGFY